MKRDKPATWLVAEDSEDDFFLLERACSHLTNPPTLRRVNNGREAQLYFESSREDNPLPSIILSDLHMPLMNGMELLHWFKFQEWLRDIPFVMLTSSDVPTDMGKAREHGADDYLNKTGEFNDLAAKIQRISDLGVNASSRRYDLSANCPKISVGTPGRT